MVNLVQDYKIYLKKERLQLKGTSCINADKCVHLENQICYVKRSPHNCEETRIDYGNACDVSGMSHKSLAVSIYTRPLDVISRYRGNIAIAQDNLSTRLTRFNMLHLQCIWTTKISVCVVRFYRLNSDRLIVLQYVKRDITSRMLFNQQAVKAFEER